MESQGLHGDWRLLLPTLPAGLVQMVFIDPPYNLGIDYGDGKAADALPPHVYLDDMRRLMDGCIRLLNATGSLWFLCPERWADQIGTLLSARLPRRNRIIWRETFGQYQESRFPSGHRHLFWHVVDELRAPFYCGEIRIPSQRMLSGDKRAKGPRIPDDVWDIPRLVGTARERIEGHPCQLPEALLERVIRCSTRRGDLVFDPTAGTGTTLRVAQRYGRRYLGIEKQAGFVKIIRRRLHQDFQTDLFPANG